jgi:hypothetical protein
VGGIDVNVPATKKNNGNGSPWKWLSGVLAAVIVTAMASWFTFGQNHPTNTELTESEDRIISKIEEIEASIDEKFADHDENAKRILESMPFGANSAELGAFFQEIRLHLDDSAYHMIKADKDSTYVSRKEWEQFMARFDEFSLNTRVQLGALLEKSDEEG